MDSALIGIKRFVEELLADLPVNLHYHSIRHTVDVFTECGEIAALENISGKDLQYLQVAALFHDTGFLYTYDGHEQESCRIAEIYLPGFGFSQEEIDRISTIIMCTVMPQKPGSLLGEIICDADLDYLGRDDYKKISEELFQELIETGRIKDRREWNDIQVEFMEKHCYFTAANRNRRNERKQQNLLHLSTAIDTL